VVGEPQPSVDRNPAGTLVQAPESPPTLPPRDRRTHTHDLSFRVLIAGPRHFTNYPALRAALDALLVNRLPDVELFTAVGRGVPMLGLGEAARVGGAGGWRGPGCG
jgi:hypothetical protein